MIVVDSSVWIDFFNGRGTAATRRLDALLGEEPVAIGDIVLVEVLRGFRRDVDYRNARALLADVEVFETLGTELAIASAENYRSLRKRGITIRGSNDAIIATACVARDLPLLYADRDFDPFVTHLGLRSALSTGPRGT